MKSCETSTWATGSPIAANGPCPAIPSQSAIPPRTRQWSAAGNVGNRAADHTAKAMTTKTTG